MTRYLTAYTTVLITAAILIIALGLGSADGTFNLAVGLIVGGWICGRAGYRAGRDEITRSGEASPDPTFTGWTHPR